MNPVFHLTNALVNALVVSLMTLAFSGSAAAETTGWAEVIDGETLRVAGLEFVLKGIDAPEAGQTCQRPGGKTYDCHRIAATGLMDLVAGATVTCRKTGAMRGGRPVAVCDANGYDLSEGMTYTGWALADPKTGGDYQRFEKTARRKGHGLWKGKFQKPWIWRREHGVAVPAN